MHFSVTIYLSLKNVFNFIFFVSHHRFLTQRMSKLQMNAQIKSASGNHREGDGCKDEALQRGSVRGGERAVG